MHKARRISCRGISHGSVRDYANRVGPNLLKRLTGVGATGGSIRETLNQYYSDRKWIDESEASLAVKEFRKFGKFSQALEVIEWMEMKNLNYSCPLQLELLSKTKGLNAAEDYMRNLPPHKQNKYTYGSLLNCYCSENLEQKALEIFDEMTQLGFVTSSLSFDSLMSMYLKMGNFEKVKSLSQDMRSRSIFFSTYTYNHLMNSFAGLNDIEGVERVIKQIESVDGQRVDWTTYSNLASIYVKAKLFEKAKVALEKLEQAMIRNGKRMTREMYHFLLRLYGTIGQPKEVSRIWEELNSSHPGFNNLSYLALIQALDKLDDLENLKKRFEEWRSRNSSYDIRLAHVVVEAYLRHGKHKEAMSVFKDAAKRTSVLFLKMREIFMFYYLRSQRVDLAMRYLETNVSESEIFKRGEEVVRAFLSYFESKKDVDGAEQVLHIVKKIYRPNSENYCSLLRIYGAAEKFSPNLRSRIEKDEVEITPEIEELLQKVCPE